MHLDVIIPRYINWMSFQIDHELEFAICNIRYGQDFKILLRLQENLRRYSVCRLKW